MKRKKRGGGSLTTSVPKINIATWIGIVQDLIGKHSTKVRTRGPYKGHASTNSVAWVAELARICEEYIRQRNRGKPYDENMALAAMMGLILSAWYAQVHRAKGMDPNRPLSRRKIFSRLARWRAALAVATTDDRIMGAVWGRGQAWNFPFGRGAKGGKFV